MRGRDDASGWVRLCSGAASRGHARKRESAGTQMRLHGTLRRNSNDAPPPRPRAGRDAVQHHRLRHHHHSSPFAIPQLFPDCRVGIARDLTGRPGTIHPSSFAAEPTERSRSAGRLAPHRGAYDCPRRPARVSLRTCVLWTSRSEGSPCGTRVRRLWARAAKGLARTANPGPCALSADSRAEPAPPSPIAGGRRRPRPDGLNASRISSRR